MYAYYINGQVVFRGAKLLTGFNKYLGELNTGTDRYKYPKYSNGKLVVDTQAKNARLAEIQAIADIGNTYRVKRAKDYIAELSPEGNFQTTTGDMIDALVEFVKSSGLPIPEKLQEKIIVIDQIKSRHQKT